jgi:hypothetical protein
MAECKMIQITQPPIHAAMNQIMDFPTLSDLSIIHYVTIVYSSFSADQTTLQRCDLPLW